MKFFDSSTTTASRAVTFLFSWFIIYAESSEEVRDKWDRREGGRKVRGQDSRRIESFGTRR